MKPSPKKFFQKTETTDNFLAEPADLKPQTNAEDPER